MRARYAACGKHSPWLGTPHVGLRHPEAMKMGYCEQKSLRFGGREGIRTLDLSVANAALSQLSYAPTAGN
jgi:hypothetical protein